METPDLSPAVVEPPLARTPGDKGARLLDLALVLFVTIAPLIVRSFYYFLGSEISTEPPQQHLRLWSALISEIGCLLVLWHVLFRQGRKWFDIGLDFQKSDIVIGFGLFLWGIVATYLVYLPIQYLHRFFTGHFIQPMALHLGLGFSAASVALLCFNPFFEELIVRAYAMTEVASLSGRRWLAFVVSIAAQMSYHFYQGWLRSIGLFVTFTIFSLYYLKTRRIMPVILAHLASDLSILLRGGQ